MPVDQISDRWVENEDGSRTRVATPGETLVDKVVAVLKETPGLEAVKATAAATELATEHGIDLTQVEGTGKGGQITKGDVEALVGD